MRTHTDYDDTYPTCHYTHAWLRIMSEDMDPGEISKILNIEPSYVQHAGEPRSPESKKLHKTSGWWISTENQLTSLDARHHLDWLLEHVAGKQKQFALLQQRQYLIDACVRWDSKSGHGGPTLSPKQMSGFGDLGIEVWFDIYFAGDDFNDT
jgi:hypothetical protein